MQRVIRRGQQLRREWTGGTAASVSRQEDETSSVNHATNGNVTKTPAPAAGGMSKAEARQTLIELRDNKIARESPKVDPKKRLLRDQMVTVLLQERPTTEKEWVERLPLWMRKETDQWQVTKYLSAVLNILSQIDEHEPQH